MTETTALKYKIYELKKSIGRLEGTLNSTSEKTVHEIMSLLGTFPGDIDLRGPEHSKIYDSDLIVSLSETGRIVVCPGEGRQILGIGSKNSDQYGWKPTYAWQSGINFDTSNRGVTFEYCPNVGEKIS